MSVTKPINHGKRWGVEEVDTLLAAIATNSSYKDIARIHGRTSGSIGGKLRQIALKMYVNKCHMDEIIRITRLTKANIEECISKYTPEQLDKKFASGKLDKYKFIPGEKPLKPKVVPVELDKYQKNAIQLFKGGYNLFITGSAGSGKSFLIRKLIEEYHQLSDSTKQGISITSTTGISSLNINGITIHSWAGITPHTDFSDVDDFVSSIKRNYKKYNNWKYTRVLVIDEISMLNLAMFDFLHKAAMKLRRNTQPFGGIQLVVVGDFFQLPPVSAGANADFVFKSVYWSELIDYSIVLKKIHRQKENDLITFLHKIRLGIRDASVQESLQHYHDNPNYNSNYTHLYPNKSNVKVYNLTKVFALEGDTIERAAIMTKKGGHTYAFPQESVIEENLILKINAFVIINKNIDSKKGLVNGRQGTFLGFVNSCAKVQTRDGNIHYIERARWEFPNYYVDQYPLRLAWALTIHKSQGMGIEKLSVDIGSNIFDDGQVYVALSRATNSEFLHVKSYSLSSIRANKQVKRFYRRLKRQSREWYAHQDDEGCPYYCNKINGFTRRSLPTGAVLIAEAPALTDGSAGGDQVITTTNPSKGYVCEVCQEQPADTEYHKYHNEKVCFNCSSQDEYYMELNRESLRKRLWISKRNIKQVLSECSFRLQENYFGGRRLSPTKLYLLGHVSEKHNIGPFT